MTNNFQRPIILNYRWFPKTMPDQLPTTDLTQWQLIPNDSLFPMTAYPNDSFSQWQFIPSNSLFPLTDRSRWLIIPNDSLFSMINHFHKQSVFLSLTFCYQKTSPTICLFQWMFISIVLCIFHKRILIFIVTFTLSFRMMRSWFGLELRVLFVQWEVLVFLDLAVDQSFRFVNWLQSFSFFFFCPEIYVIWYAHTKYLRFYSEQISILHICSWKSISSR